VRKFRGDREAFGKPGIDPRWTHGNKQGIGTAYSVASKVWLTLWNGVVTEIYYPTIDRPQTRDVQYLISDGKSFFHEEKKDLKSTAKRLCNHALGFKITNSDPDRRYAIEKEIISDPHLPCILQHTKLTGAAEFISQLQLYALCAPHIEVSGQCNSGYVLKLAGREILVAERAGIWLAMAATMPFKRLSVGYVGKSDGWQDLAENYRLDWEFDRAEEGNIALTGEIDLSSGYEFTLATAFGNTLHQATTTLLQSLDIPFSQHHDKFIQQWNRTCDKLLPLDKVATDGGNLYDSSFSLLLAHEDKTYLGATIASLSIPWGQKKGDSEKYGGYHLVWPRDLYNTSTAMLAAGYTETPLRTLVYLASCQRADGGFAQNFWIDGSADRDSVQLDEVGYPILLAWRLYKADALRNFDPYPMVISAAGYLVSNGPITPQERWEQSSGYSPSTLAVTIAALICAASWARDRGDRATAKFVEEYADFLNCHLEAWTVTTEGTIHPEIKTHYIRITPAEIGDRQPNENPNIGDLYIPHRHPDSQQKFPAQEIVDPSFLELVKYGIRDANDPIIVDSLKVVDAVLKTDTPNGPVWRRYNNDGHGQREDGSAWDGWGTGRSWTLLTGERGQYELAAGRDPMPYIKAMEGFASPTGLIPEQVWDAEDIPEAHMYLGEATGSAMPLMWSHSEYIKLLRSAFDGKGFEYIPEVGDRYGKNSGCDLLEIWKPNRQVSTVKPNYTLRIQKKGCFRLRWSTDEWQNSTETDSNSTSLGICYVDISVSKDAKAPIHFTFISEEDDTEYQVAIAT